MKPSRNTDLSICYKIYKDRDGFRRYILLLELALFRITLATDLGVLRAR